MPVLVRAVVVGLAVGLLGSLTWSRLVAANTQYASGVPWATAILVTGSLFAFSHFNHPEVGLALLPFYLAVAAVYGLLAAATNSTYPGIVLHAGGNLFSAFSFFAQGRSEWELTASPAPTIWQAGLDASFLATVGGVVVVGGAAALAYRRLFGRRDFKIKAYLDKP